MPFKRGSGLPGEQAPQLWGWAPSSQPLCSGCSPGHRGAPRWRQAWLWLEHFLPGLGFPTSHPCPGGHREPLWRVTDTLRDGFSKPRGGCQSSMHGSLSCLLAGLSDEQFPLSFIATVTWMSHPSPSGILLVASRGKACIPSQSLPNCLPKALPRGPSHQSLPALL